jgi:NAD(P)-dependent dehydrogenase (short-subunit alcohol dehydrogenase family)
MNANLKGKVALVTGAGSQVGFGKGICLALAEAGCDLAVNDVNGDGANQTAAAVKAIGRKALPVKADITRVDEVKSMVQQVLNKFGRIDILVNNAGRATQRMSFVDTPEKNWQIVFNLNVYGTFYVTQAVLPSMIERKYGIIINIASGAGISGMPGCLHYGASKAAVIAFTRGLAKEVISSGISVNAIAPGLGDTNFLSTAGYPADEIQQALPRIPSGKTTTPEQVGYLAVYLASEQAANFVGQTLLMDGGMG